MELLRNTARPRRSGAIPVALVVVVAAAVVGMLVAWLLVRGGPPQQKEPVATAEARAYIHQLKLTEVSMDAHENFAKQMLVEITGKIANAGNRPVKLVELNCVFYDPYGRVVLRQRTPIVGAKMGGLKPGQTKNFRMAFDTLPESWNQAMPQLVIAQIIFG
jgi:hypothetical protein